METFFSRSPAGHQWCSLTFDLKNLLEFICRFWMVVKAILLVLLHGPFKISINLLVEWDSSIDDSSGNIQQLPVVVSMLFSHLLIAQFDLFFLANWSFECTTHTHTQLNVIECNQFTYQLLFINCYLPIANIYMQKWGILSCSCLYFR